MAEMKRMVGKSKITTKAPAKKLVGPAAVQGTKGVPNAGKKIGAVSGAAAGAAGVSAKKKKSK